MAVLLMTEPSGARLPTGKLSVRVSPRAAARSGGCGAGVLCLGECRVGRLLVAHHQREGEVAHLVVVPDLGRALLRRIRHVHYRGQRLVVHFDPLGSDAR